MTSRVTAYGQRRYPSSVGLGGWLLSLYLLLLLCEKGISEAAPKSPPVGLSTPGDWHPVPGHIMTRWSKEVSPTNVWAEYPRPQMVRSQWCSLNGLWDYAIVGPDGPWKEPNVLNTVYDPLLKGLPRPPARWQGKILVPFGSESALSGVGRLVRPSQLLWYGRWFDVPADWQRRRILLHFEAVDWHCVVWVNGQKVGENKGGYVPFSFDITEALKPAAPQELTVAVWDPSNAGDQAVGKQTLPELKQGWRYTPTTGIWQPVWLEPVPDASIAELALTPDVEHERLEARVGLRGAAGGGEIELRAFDGGKLVAATRGPAARTLALAIPQPKLWSPQSPFLYDLEVTLYREGQRLDTVSSYFGMREIKVAPDTRGVPRITLNGQEIFSFGPLDQGYWPDGVLTPPSDQAAKSHVQSLRDLGCNLVRVHVKVQPSRYYYWCDRLGVMVWQDFVCLPKYGSTLTPPGTAQWEGEQARMLDHLQNHPAIVMWVIFNEGWGQHDTERLTKWVQERDPSRLVNHASGSDAGLGDVYDVHDYRFYPSIAQPGQLGRRPMLLGECGGFNLVVPGHTWEDYPNHPGPVDELNGGVRESYRDATSWAARYTLWLENLRLLRCWGLCGAVYTQLTDVEHECNGWLTYDREVCKIPAEQLKQLHQRLYGPLPSFKTLVPMRPAESAASAPPGQNQRLQRPFTLQTLPRQVLVCASGAGAATVYLNGQRVRQFGDRPRQGYAWFSLALLAPELMKALHPGTNTLTVELSAPRNMPRAATWKPYEVGLFELEQLN